MGESSVMNVYNQMSTLIGGNFGRIPTNLFSMQNAVDAGAAYTAFLGFKEKVKAAQPAGTSAGTQSEGTGSAASDAFTGAALILLAASVLPNIMAQWVIVLASCCCGRSKPAACEQDEA